jgi:hypothetical protein
MANAGRAVAAALGRAVPGCQPGVSNAAVWERVPSREPANARAGAGAEVGRCPRLAVEVRLASTGGAGRITTTKGMTALFLLVGRPSDGASWPRTGGRIFGWKLGGQTELLREKQSALAANWR